MANFWKQKYPIRNLLIKTTDYTDVHSAVANICFISNFRKQMSAIEKSMMGAFKYFFRSK